MPQVDRDGDTEDVEQPLVLVDNVGETDIVTLRVFVAE